MTYVYTSPLSPTFSPPSRSSTRASSRPSTRASTRASSFSEYSSRNYHRAFYSLSSSLPSSETWSPPQAECGCCPSSTPSSSALTSDSSAPQTPTSGPSSRSLTGKVREGLFHSATGELLLGKRTPEGVLRVYAARQASWVNGDVEGVGDWFRAFMLSQGVQVLPHGGRFRLTPAGPNLAWMKGSLDIFRPADDARCAHCRAHKVQNWRGTAVAFPCVVEAEWVAGSVAPVSACAGCRAAGLPCDLYRGADAPPAQQRLDVWNLPELLALCRDAAGTLGGLARSTGDKPATPCQRAALEGVARDLGWLAQQLEHAKRPDKNSKL